MKKEYIKPIIIIIKHIMMMLYYKQHRFMITTKSILLKILPAKMTNRYRSEMIMISFGMTNNFISRFSKKYKA